MMKLLKRSESGTLHIRTNVNRAQRIHTISLRTSFEKKKGRIGAGLRVFGSAIIQRARSRVATPTLSLFLLSRDSRRLGVWFRHWTLPLKHMKLKVSVCR